jgi:hypothetical protein
MTGATAPMGACSGKYIACVNGTLIGKVCPVGTIFDGSIGVCVFSLPNCPVSSTTVSPVPAG